MAESTPISDFGSLHSADDSSFESSIGDNAHDVPRFQSREEDSPRKKLHNYAMRMNFTDQEFEQCLSELGGEVKDIDSDKLLRHLVQIRELNRNGPHDVTMTRTRHSSCKASLYSNKIEFDPRELRRIVIDGSNVAMEHGNHQIYSCRGIEIVVNYFQARRHEHITVFVPAHRLQTEHRETKDQHILNGLSRRGVVVKTPSRKSSKGNIASYEDRFILKLASMEEAIVVSNDRFRNLIGNSSAFRDTIEKRILTFEFANDQFVPDKNPLGAHGPSLEQFLRGDSLTKGCGPCPYGRKCTYGIKCKYEHSKRADSLDETSLREPVEGFLHAGSVRAGRHMSADPLPGPHCRSTAGRPRLYEQHTPGSFTSTTPAQPILSNPFYRGQSPVGYSSADYPLARQANQPHLASRVHLHMANSESYYSGRHRSQSMQTMPGYMQTLSRSADSICSPDMCPFSTPQPLDTSGSLSSSDSLKQENIHPYDVSTADVPVFGPWSGDPRHFSEINPSSTLQPLNENISSSSQYPTYVLPGRVPAQQYHQPQQHGRHDAPIPKDDPRYHMYFYLTNLFSEHVVRRVMNRLPHEKDPNKITAAVLELQARTKDR